MFNMGYEIEKSKIMIVEDEAIAALDIQIMLEELGYNTTDPIPTGEEAIAKINELNPDLVLMDISLDGLFNGIETAEKIKNAHHLPVVFLTAHADLSTMKDADRIKPYGYLIKPVNKNDLRLTISSALQRAKIEKSKKNE